MCGATHSENGTHSVSVCGQSQLSALAVTGAGVGSRSRCRPYQQGGAKYRAGEEHQNSVHHCVRVPNPAQGRLYMPHETDNKAQLGQGTILHCPLTDMKSLQAQNFWCQQPLPPQVTKTSVLPRKMYNTNMI